MLFNSATKRKLQSVFSSLLVLTLVFADVFVVLEHGFSRAPQAEAAVGSFSVFRNQSDTSAVLSGAGEVEVSWDTVISESADIDLLGDGTTIDLVDAGKYLVLYNVWTTHVTNATNERRSFETYLTLDETPLAIGRGDGYIRNAAADDLEAYAAGAAVIEVSAGADLKINIARDDTSPGGLAAIRAGTNGVSVLRLSDELDYLRLRKTTRGGDISGNTSFTDVTYETADEIDTGSFAFTTSTGDITLKGDTGSYFMVTSNVRLNQDAGSGSRQNYVGRLTLDGTEIPGTRSSAYLRGNANSNGIISGTVVYTGLVRKTSSADQTLNVEVIREAVSGSAATDIVAGETAISIVALPPGGNYISLTSDASQAVPNTQAPLSFDEQLEVDSAAFSHSVVTDSSRIEIDADGDYLFFSTVFAERANTGNGDRDPYRVDWRLDGTNTLQYGGHGSFLRGDQGTEDSYQAGSSGGVLLPGLTASQFLELTMFDPVDNADATIGDNQIALQGVEISGLIPVPDSGTVVSVIGDQTATVAGRATNVFSGQQISIAEIDASRNITSVRITESGTVAADTSLTNTRLFYDIDVTAPYDCASESYAGTESEFGSTGTFSGANGVLTFNDSLGISPTDTFCGYVVYDLTSSAADGETVNFSINNPSLDVVVTGGADVSPSFEIGADSLTTIVDAELTQANYHWRNDDGSETGATSLTGGIENTPGLAFDTSTPQRLRLGVTAEGTGTEAIAYRLEYGEKVTTCDDVLVWSDVGASGGAWDMFNSPNIVEGDNTTNISVATGGVSDGSGSLVNPNGGLRDVSSETGVISVTANDFIELEYSVIATEAAVEGLAYCFRVADTASQAPFLAGYDSRISLTVPASSVDAELTDFPVYVNLANLGSSFWSDVASDGRDIRVSTGDGVTEVPFELVSIDSGSDSGELYFKAPTLRSNIDTEFFIYFNNPSVAAYAVTDPFGRNNVWTNGFIAVYHLEEDGSVTDFIDSTGNGNEGTGASLDGADQVAGKIPGNALNLDGTPEAVTAADSPDFDWTTGSISGWLQTDTLTSDGTLASRGGGGTSEMLVWFDEGVDDIVCAASIGGSFYNGSGGGTYTTRTTGEWIHGFCSWDGTSLINYSNGVANFTSTAPSGSLLNAANAATIGRDAAARFLDGRLDEVRYHNTGRTAAWVSAEYENQDNPGAFYSVGSVEVPQSPVDTISYDIYPEATLSADVTVSARGTQVATADAGDSDVYVGGQFVISNSTGLQTVSSIMVTEIGTVDASTQLSNPTLAIDFDTIAPYDCVSESYDGGEPTISGTAFTNKNGSSTFAGGGSISPTRTMCVYVLVDITPEADEGETIKFEINSPNTDVVVAGVTVGPGSPIELTGSTSINAPALNQASYHWRNNDGDEVGATSATGGAENTPIVDVLPNNTKRLRMAVSNDGSLSSSGTNLRLEYGVKLTTCGGVGSWQRVDSGVAFTMASTSQLVEGNNTTPIAVLSGGITDPNTTFLTPNFGQKEDDDETSALSLSTSNFVEVEFAIESTNQAAFDTDYCFRLTDGGVPLSNYTNYPELNTQERQDFVVQRGTETILGTSTTLVAGSDYNAPLSSNRAYIRITNTTMTGAGSDSLGQTRTPDELTAYIENPDNIMDSITITRPDTADDNTRVSWEIIEYVGIGGADNEMIIRDAGTVTYGGSSLFATGTAVAGIADDSDVAVFITGQINPATNVQDYNTGLSVSSWNASTDQPVFERGDADSIAAGVSYVVIEYTGANWRVQRAEHTFAAAGVTETETITTVNSLARTFLQAQKLSGNELFNLDESGHEVWLSSIGAVSFRLEAGSTNPSEQKSVAWVVENTQVGDGAMEVYRSNGQIDQNATQPNSFLISIGATINPDSSSIWANNRSTGGGSAHPRALLGARIVNATQYELWKSDEGQNQNFRVEIVDWPVAETSIRQTDYRLYVDSDAVQPVDAWPPGLADLGENEAMTDLDEPLGAGERTRIRMSLFINNATLVAGSQSFKLQYSRRVTTCSAALGWEDVGQPGSGEVWRGVDAAPLDGAEISSTLISVSDVAGTYEEANPSAVNPNTVDIAESVEYDWLIENNGAIQKSSYCFRMVENNGSELDGYNLYPTVRTSGYTPVINSWRWYNDENNLTPTSPLAGERVSPSNVPLNEVLKLRVSVTELEGAPGDNIKFNLQYSEHSDFSDGGTTLTPTSTCSGNSLWCYADGAGDNDDVIETAVLSGVAACSVGVGLGCGTVNEAEGLFGVYDQPAFSTSEHEFTLRHDGARVNAVYYFRLVDATNGVNLLASSSYPSLITEGASLTFQVSGVDNAESIEGIVTDATSTATSIDFGSLPVDTDVEVAQRLTVLTNGTQGYQVYMQFDQELLNSYGEAIPSIGSTNAAPATWESVCTGATTGCFGYHAGDNVLYDGSLRFSLDNRYSGVETGPVEVMASNVPVLADESEIVYKTRITRLQPGGDYTTRIQYIAVPIF